MKTPHIEKMFADKHYISCRNYCEWAFNVRPDIFNTDDTPEEYRCWAVSAFRTGDILGAKPLLERLTRMPAYAEDQELHKMLQTASNANPFRIVVLCDNKEDTQEIRRLISLIERHTYTYSAITTTIKVFVPKDQADYESVFRKTFPNEPIEPYNEFSACGFYYKREMFLWLVFKPETIAMSVPDSALEGLVAHELAHFQLYSNGVAVSFWYNNNYQTDKMLIEPLTDLCAIAHGLAYPLYCARSHFGASKYVLSANDIVHHLANLQKP